MAFTLQTHREVAQVETRQDTALGIMRWGRNNSFPQTFKNLVEQSPTAKPAVHRTAKFYKGMRLEVFEDPIVNPSGMRLSKIIDICAKDYSLFSAFAIHCNFNVKGEVTSMSPMRITTLRFNQFDELGYASKIGYHPNFSRNSEVQKTITDIATRQSIKWFDTFNPDAVIEQIKNTEGGVANYLGQILYYSDEGMSSYPIPTLQAPINYVLADIENSILMRKESATGFINSYLLKTSMDSEDPTLHALESSIEEAQGARGSGKIITMSGLSDDDLAATTLEQIASGSGTSTVVDSVGSALSTCQKVIFNAYLLPPILGGAEQRNGFSGTDLTDAYFIFNSVTQEGRSIIESEINSILAIGNFTAKSVKIRKLRLDTDEQDEQGGEQGSQDVVSKFDPESSISKIFRDMTGRQQQQLNRIHANFNKGKLSYSQAALQLKRAYDFDDEMVELWLKGDEENK